MIFLPPNPQSNKNRSKNLQRRTLKGRYNTIATRSGMGKKVGNSLSTSQGMSTLKIVLMYSVLGMILHWVLPIVILKMNPEMLEEDAQYYGTLYAVITTGFFLTVSLLKGLIVRNRSQSQTQSPDTNTQLFRPRPKNSDKQGNLDGR